MNKASVFKTEVASAITALSVFPKPEDHAALRSIFHYTDWQLSTGFEFALKNAKSVDEARPILRNGDIPVVLCERDLQPGTWRDMVEELAALPDPPYLIVTSRQADDRLWVEALNLGAYDVLQTPFRATEVIRTLSLAWLRWAARHKPTLANVARSVA